MTDLPASEVLVRDAVEGDHERLVAWGSAMAWETERKRLDPATVGHGVRAGLADPGRARYFVAERDCGADGIRPAGTLMLTFEWSDWRNGHWWWIQSVYVDEAHRRQGVFAALYRHVYQLARDTPGVCGLRLYVEKENIAAQRTYESLGMVDARYCMYEASMPWLSKVIG